MVAYWLNVTVIALCTINVLLHGIGLYLLWCLHQQSYLRIHHVYVMSLSGSEFIMNFLEVLKISMSFYPSPAVTSITYYIGVVQFTGAGIIFHLSINFITLDRLMEILLNIKYPVYWNDEKARKLLIGMWAFNALLTLVIGLLHALVGFQWENFFFTYFYPFIEFVFVGLALATYLFIFKKFSTSRTFPAIQLMHMGGAVGGQSGGRPRQRRNSMQTFRRSKFFIPVLLILTFLVFIVSADLTFLFVAVIGGKDSSILRAVLAISYCLSNLTDAWIYILLESEVKSLLFRKLHTICGKTV